MVAAKPDRGGIAGGKQRVLAMAAAIPYRPDGVDHMLCRQTISAGDLGAAGLAATEGATFGKELRTGRAMDRAVDAASAEERTIRSVDDGVNAEGRDVGDDNLKPGLADLARRNAQAEAAALRVTPLSAMSCCNSPAWNISRMMSQPPTNSPLT